MAKILVVDDEPDMIWALTNVLLSENHSVVSVNSGEEALEKIKQTVVDLVLLDFRLPGMDGIQILQKIKEVQPNLPVIMVTGYGGVEEAVQSIKLGASHYLPKPFDNKHLTELVNKSLQVDVLKKEGVFGKRALEKIEPQTSPGAQPPESAKPTPRFGPKKRPLKPIVISALIFISTLVSAFYWVYKKNVDKEYSIVNSKVSGLSWGGGRLWLCDWYSQNVQQYQLIGKKLELLKTIPLPGYHLTGIAWGDGFLYTCDSWKKAIFKHYPDNALSIAGRYPSPGPNPSGLFYDGKYLWSCDGNTRKIYQHALDDQLTVLSIFDSPALFPVGLYHDKKDFWSASAIGMKIFKNLLQERFQLEKTYVFPDSFEVAQQLSAFTLNDEKIWIAYEGVSKIFKKDLKSLQEVLP